MADSATSKVSVLKGTVPVVHQHYDPEQFRRWKSAMKAWIDGGRLDASVFGPLGIVAKRRRIICFNGAPRSHGFAEAYVAAHLERQGFSCWTGVQLFPWNGRNVVAPDRKENTEQVEALLKKDGFVIPRSLLPRLAEHQKAHGRLKNPDLVCRHRRTGEWRCLEVKRDEAVEDGQLWALVLLHYLTGAAVAIHRLIPEGRRLPAERNRRAEVTLSADGAPERPKATAARQVSEIGQRERPRRRTGP